MSFLSKLFGKKKKPTAKVQEPERQVVQEEVVVKEQEVPVVETQEVEEKASVQEEVKEPQQADVLDVYEVRTHDQGGWQVIKQGGKRATRRFDTQAQCIEFCKENNMQHIIYKKDGTLR